MSKPWTVSLVALAAFACGVSAAGASFAISTAANESIAGTSFDRADVVRHDAGTLTTLFDGSSFSTVGENVDAFHLLPNGHAILSTAAEATLGGLTFKPGDLVDYDPETGSAVLFLRGQDVFTTTTADIDAVYVRATGPGCDGTTGAGCKIVLSVAGNAALKGSPGTTYHKGDAIEVDPATKTGTKIFDHTAFSVTNLNLDAVHVRSDGRILLSHGAPSARGLGGITFKSGDIAEYDPATDTATVVFLESTFDGAANIDALYQSVGKVTGVATEPLDSWFGYDFTIVSMPTTFVISGEGGACDEMAIDFGDGTTTTASAPGGFPVTVEHTYPDDSVPALLTWFYVTVTGTVSCTGMVSDVMVLGISPTLASSLGCD